MENEASRWWKGKCYTEKVYSDIAAVYNDEIRKPKAQLEKKLGRATRKASICVQAAKANHQIGRVAEGQRCDSESPQDAEEMGYKISWRSINTHMRPCTWDSTALAQCTSTAWQATIWKQLCRRQPKSWTWVSNVSWQQSWPQASKATLARG